MGPGCHGAVHRRAKRTGDMAQSRFGRATSGYAKVVQPGAGSSGKALLGTRRNRKEGVYQGRGAKHCENAGRQSFGAPFIIEAFRARRLPPILGLYIAMDELWLK